MELSQKQDFQKLETEVVDGEIVVHSSFDSSSSSSSASASASVAAESASSSSSSASSSSPLPRTSSDSCVRIPTATPNENENENENDDPVKLLAEARERISFLEQRLLSIGASIDYKHGRDREEERDYGKIGVPCCGTSDFGVSLEEYIATPNYKVMLKRLPWLICLLIIQSFSASILKSFDSLLDKHFIVAFFVPMLTGTGGNAGNQPSVMITRALGMPGTRKPIKRLVIKEMKLAITLGLILGIFTFIRVIAEYSSQPIAATAIAIALTLEVIISVCAGVLFSVGIDKLKNCDPADGAAPLVTTMCDLIGISLLCGIAGSMLDN